MEKHKRPNWVEKAQFRIANKKWLEYSSQIARRIMSEIIKDKDNSQKKLSEALEVSPQMVSKIIKGQENLTLKSIAKISDVLGVELIAFPKYRYSIPAIESSTEIKVTSNQKYIAQYRFMNVDEITSLTTHTHLAHQTGGDCIGINKPSVEIQTLYKLQVQ